MRPLTPLQRESLFNKIKKIVLKHEINVLSSKKVDEALESEHLNLNWLEAIVSAEIIDKLNPDKAILDCPSNNIEAYSNYVKKHLTTFVVEYIKKQGRGI